MEYIYLIYFIVGIITGSVLHWLAYRSYMKYVKKLSESRQESSDYWYQRASEFQQLLLSKNHAPLNPEIKEPGKQGGKT